ncbi:MAG: exosortase/archaeosortase family protein [bacterium]|nr:exosortase/archaeosortase family protein [bacterium]
MRSATAVDAAWFGMVSLLLILSPVTGAGWPVAEVALGVLGGGVALAIRLVLRRREAPGCEQWTLSMPAVSVWIAAIGLLAISGPTLAWLYERYTESIWRNPHGLFVAFFALLMVRHRLREDGECEADSSPWAFAWLMPGCLLIALDAGIRSHYISLFGLLLILPGLSLLFLGARRTRRMVFPLSFCVFLLPLPDGMGDPLYLPTLTSEIGASLAQIAGLDVERVGTRIAMEGGVGIEVTQNCSGLSFFYSGCALAYLCLGFTRSWPRRVAVLAAPYLLTTLANGLRIALLLLVGSSFGLDWKYDTPLHGALGTGAYLGVMLGIGLLSDFRRLREGLS